MLLLFTDFQSSLKGEWKGRLETTSGRGDWKERLERATGKSDGKERSPFPFAVSIRRFHSPFPFAVSIRRFHSPFPFAVSIRRFWNRRRFAGFSLNGQRETVRSLGCRSQQRIRAQTTKRQPEHRHDFAELRG